MNSGRVVFGIIVIVIGAVFLLDNTVESVSIGAVSQWWPMLLVFFGVWRLVANGFRSLFLPLLLIAIGVIFQLRQLDIIPAIDFGTYWPLIPIAVGIAILAGGFRRRRRRRSNPSSGSSAVIDIDATSVTEGDSINATLSTDNKTVSGDFQSGNINVVMGNGSLDLRSARIVSKPATLDVSVVMGEVKVRVPAEWDVQINNSSLMGETKDTRGSRSSDGDNPDLIISGSVTMGSLQIED